MTKATMRLSVALLACLLLALPVAAKDIARVSVSAGELVFTPEAAVAGFQLTVTGPGGYAYAETFDGSGAMTWAAQAADGGLLANGAYSYELRPVAHQVKRGSVADLELGKPELTALSGTVTVRGGSLVDPDQREEPLTKDVVHNDDVIITGSLCVGFDCVNGENFGFDTIRLKENNTRIKFQDTSTGSFPSNDWQLTANDSASGGANKFSIDDIDGGRTPFTIEAGAPSHSLYVDDGGRIGVGTNTPVVEVHVVDGDSPTLRLQQDGSSGFTPQTWDVAANETNFFVRDATNGSTLPFRIRPGAPTSSIDIAADGDVGMGTASPNASLHILESGSAHTPAFTTNLLLQNNATSGNGVVLMLIGGDGAGGNAQIAFGSASDEDEGLIVYRPNINDMRFFTNGALRATLNDTGLDVVGTVTSDGPTCGGGCDRVFQPGFELESIEEHAAHMWQNSYLPGVGPTPENGERINLTEKTGGILNELEKAHIYIEQLHDTIQQLEQRLEKLEVEKGQ